MGFGPGEMEMKGSMDPDADFVIMKRNRRNQFELIILDDIGSIIHSNTQILNQIRNVFLSKLSKKGLKTYFLASFFFKKNVPAAQKILPKQCHYNIMKELEKIS